jgi:hypothetical protein
MQRFRFFSERILGSMLLGGLTGGKGNLLVILALPKKFLSAFKDPFKEQSIPGLKVGLCNGESGKSIKSGTANCMIRLMGFLGVELCIGGGGELGISMYVRVSVVKSQDHRLFMCVFLCCKLFSFLFKDFSDGLKSVRKYCIPQSYLFYIIEALTILEVSSSPHTHEDYDTRPVFSTRPLNR